MPAVIPFLAVWGVYIAEAVIIAYSFYDANRQAIKARQQARDAFNASLQDRTITVRSGVSPWKYVLGTARTSGALLYAGTCDESSTAHRLHAGVPEVL